MSSPSSVENKSSTTPDLSNVTPEAIQEALKGDKIINAISEIVRDPIQMDKMMKDSAKKMTPEFMAKMQEMGRQQTAAGPDAPPINADMLKEAMKGTNLNTAITSLMNDPAKLSALMEESVGKMTPQMQEQAKKMASSGKIDTVMKELQRQGKSPKLLKKEMDAQHKLFKATQPKPTGPTKRIVMITSNRQLRSKTVPATDMQKTANDVMKVSTAIGLACSRLAVGPFYNKTVTIWYDEKNPTKNKRASKLLGYSIGGDVMIVVDECDIEETEFEEAEKLIC